MLYDRDIREPLFDFLDVTYGKIRILEEKRTGRARADVIMITEDAVHGIEIKSDADSYARLARQVKWYDQYYDFNTVVIGVSHVRHIEEHVPNWWGIITVEESEGIIDFYIARRPKSNPNQDPMRKIGIMWRPELNQMLAINGLPAYRQKSKAFVQEKLVEKVEPMLRNRQMSDLLFERDYTTIGEELRTYRAEHRKRRKSRTSANRSRSKIRIS